jgi:uncharacterized protein
MIIRVAEIPGEGLEVEDPRAFPHPFQDPAWSLDAVSLTVEKDGEAVLIQGTLAARVPQHCGRCLEPYAVTVTPEVDARFVPNPRRRGEEVELGAEDLDTDVYDNGVLDLATLLETETTLLLPMKPLCREDCRGLCPICGTNRNVSTCHCEVATDDPRWAPLKAWAARLSK